MFDKKAFMSHVQNENAHNKITRAGIKEPVQEEREQLDEFVPLVIGAAKLGAGLLGRAAVGAAAKGGAKAAAKGAAKKVAKKVAKKTAKEVTKKGGKGLLGKAMDAITGKAKKTVKDALGNRPARATYGGGEEAEKVDFKRVSGVQDSYDPTILSRMIDVVEKKKYGKKITKSHGKYPKGTHMCATHVEHAEWGTGTPIHGEHAAPDENGHISWYNVMFEHGTETIQTSEVKVLGLVEHENHDHDGEELSENVLNDPVEEPYIKAGKKKSKKSSIRCEDMDIKQVLRLIASRGGEKTPGRGEKVTDHKKRAGEDREGGEGRNPYDHIKSKYGDLSGEDRGEASRLLGAARGQGARGREETEKAARELKRKIDNFTSDSDLYY